MSSSTSSRRTLRRGASIAAVLVIVLAGCSDDGSDSASETTTGSSGDRAAVQARLADDVIAPRYQAIGDRTVAARDAVAAACAAPSQATIDAAVAAVIEARNAWEALEAIDFGPIMTLRADRFVGYPAAPDKIDERLASPPPDEDAATTRLASDARGLGAAEYLLGVAPDVFTDPARCVYLTSIMATAVTRVEEVRAAWFDEPDPYLEHAAGRADDAITAKELIDTLVNMSTDVFASDLKALDAGPDDPAVRRAIVVHAATMSDLWGDGQTGLSPLVDTELADQLRAELDTLNEAANAPGFDPEAVADAIEAARATLGADVVGALDVTVGFSENDGDS